MFKRIKEFQDPPLVFYSIFYSLFNVLQVERSELLPELQPQNRVFSKIRALFNRQSLYNKSLEHSSPNGFIPINKEKNKQIELEEEKNESEIQDIIIQSNSTRD